MKQIEITTTQNVAIKYNVAPSWSRYVSVAIDLLIMGLVGWLLFAIADGVVESELTVFFTFFPVFLFYSLLFETFNKGATPGKRILGNRVIRLDGKDITFMDYLAPIGTHIFRPPRGSADQGAAGSG